MRCIATLCVATAFVVRAEDTDIATQMAKLVANDASNYDWFGISVAISDGIAVVGAREDDDNGSSSGSAYVFEMISSGNSSSWAQVAKLTADDGAARDRLGVSVAISDGIIVVGAPWDDNKKGSAYVFKMSSSDDASSWAQVAKLTVGSAGDNFGTSVAISDGTLVVGAHCDDDKGSDSGSVYVFEMSSPGDASSFAQVAKLTAADGASNNYFGTSAVISDGTIVVGARATKTNNGAAYLFEKSSSDDASSWTQVAKLKADDGAKGDDFGYSVAIRDGIIAVGARLDDDKGSDSGSAYLFQMSSPGDASSFTQVAKLTANDGGKDDWFGVSVAIGDGTIIVGALHDSDIAYRSGAAYVFEMSSPGNASSCTQVAKLTADDGGFRNHFGRNIAISDGTAIISAHGNSHYKGAAYIFQVKTESPPPALPSPPPSQIVPDEKTITLFAGCSPLDKLTFNVENFKEQVGAMLITKSLSNDFKYDKAVQMESSDCGTFTTNTIPAQGEEFGFYLYNLNNFTEYDAVSDIGCEGTDTEKCPPGDVWTSLATCTNSVEGPGYTAHHRVFDGETFSYNWGTCDSTCATPPATCQQDLEPVLGLSASPHSSLFPMLPAPAVGLFAVAMASALAFVVVSKRRDTIVPGTVSTSSSKEARYGAIDV
jgi:hypothetical protein